MTAPDHASKADGGPPSDALVVDDAVVDRMMALLRYVGGTTTMQRPSQR